MSYPRRGHTLMEIVVYAAIFLVLLLAIYALFDSAHRMAEGASGSYLVSAEFEAGVRQLRRELQETALITVRPFPNAADTAATPGVSFVSAQDSDHPEIHLLSPHGVPQWNQHVYYTIEADRSSNGTGTLYRWTKTVTPQTFLPIASTLPPSPIADGQHKRAILLHVLLPGKTFPGVGPGGAVHSDEHGGFRVAFVKTQPNGPKLDELLTDWNPAQVSGGGAPASEDPKNLTGLVQVDLQGFTTSDTTGKGSFYHIHFRVAPRF